MGIQEWSAEAWTAAGTWATVLIALAAAVFAWQQVRHARELREAQAQPFIVVNLENSRLDTTAFVLRVENIGNTLARDVRFTFTPGLDSVLATKDERYDLAGSRLLTEGLPMMPPGMKVERLFDRVIEWPKERGGLTLAYDVTVTYADHTGKPQPPLTYLIDIRPILEGVFINERTVHHAAKALEDIRTAVKGWTRRSTALNVLTRDGHAYDQEIQKALEDDWRDVDPDDS